LLVREFVRDLMVDAIAEPTRLPSCGPWRRLSPPLGFMGGGMDLRQRVCVVCWRGQGD